jgi:hypothetical protein
MKTHAEQGGDDTRLVFQFEVDGPEPRTVSVILPNDFPYEDLLELGTQLEIANVLTPGYVAPAIGLCHLEGFLYEQSVELRETVLLSDRNIVSRWAQIAKGARADDQLRTAAAIMAFAQHLEIKIEPAIAFHELADVQGNASANEEIAWFRSADNGDPRQWLDYALGRIDALSPPYQQHPVKDHQLAYPLRRWRRNYAATLKIGSLELDGLQARQRIFLLLDWMDHEFMVAGPAALMACMYFAPNSPPRKGLLKQLKSPDRERAIQGARNAAWDISYLSDFAHRLNEAEGGSVRYLFASLDRALHQLAQSLIAYGGDGLRRDVVATGLARWWPPVDAENIAMRLHELFTIASASIEAPRAERPSNYVSDAIAIGEQRLRASEGGRGSEPAKALKEKDDDLEALR